MCAGPGCSQAVTLAAPWFLRGSNGVRGKAGYYCGKACAQRAVNAAPELTDLVNSKSKLCTGALCSEVPPLQRMLVGKRAHCARCEMVDAAGGIAGALGGGGVRGCLRGWAGASPPRSPPASCCP